MQTGRANLLEQLMERGADIHARDNKGNTALILMAGYGYDLAVSILLKHGADINARANNGCTPLLAAISYPDTVRVLLAHRADVHARMKDGRTALKLAKEVHQSDVVRMLKRTGAIL